MDVVVFLWLSGACFLAYFLKGFSGFGPALVLVPAVSLLFGPRTALTASILVDLVVGVCLLRVLRLAPADRPLVLRLALFMAAGSVAGATLAGSVPTALLLRVIAVVVLVFGGSLIVFHRPVPPNPLNAGAGTAQPRRRVLDLACLGGGFTGGLTGISGPLIVAAARPHMDKTTFRRVLVALFLLEGVVRIAVYAAIGMWPHATWRVAGAAAPGVLLGLLAGLKSHVAVGERAFSTVVGTILVALALRLLLAG